MARSISHHDGFKNISIRPKAAQALTVAPNERHVANMTIEEAANAREEAEVEALTQLAKSLTRRSSRIAQ